MPILKKFLFLVSSLFSLFGLAWFGPSAATISELDDILIIVIFGFPLIIISSGISLWLLYLGCKKLFLFPTAVNSLTAITAVSVCSSGIIDVLTFQNELFIGNKENNYHSLDLFIIAVVPVLCVFVNWLFFFLKRPSKIKATTP